MEENNKEYKQDRLITIEEYLWNTNPQQLIDIKNIFLENKIKVIK